MSFSIQVLRDQLEDYALLDCGNCRKLERFGTMILDRSEPRALWQPTLPQKKWQNALAVFHPSPNEGKGNWEFRNRINSSWIVKINNLNIQLRISPKSRHVGVFPEQSVHWYWIESDGARMPLLSF